MNESLESKILESVEKGYDQMAEKFSNTRNYFWPDFNFIRNYIKNGDNLLDFGCGNGRLLEILKDKKIEYYGVDASENLINIAQKKYFDERINFQKISSLQSLPFPDNFFNDVVSISVFHHFPQKKSQEMAKEFYRVTKPGGMIIVSVWNLWQRRHWKYIFNPRLIKDKIFRIGKYKDFGIKDIVIPFKNNQGEIFDRFHYVFGKRELGDIFLKAGFKIEKIFVLNKKNIFFIGRK